MSLLLKMQFTYNFPAILCKRGASLLERSFASRRLPVSYREEPRAVDSPSPEARPKLWAAATSSHTRGRCKRGCGPRPRHECHGPNWQTSPRKPFPRLLICLQHAWVFFLFLTKPLIGLKGRKKGPRKRAEKHHPSNSTLSPDCTLTREKTGVCEKHISTAL